MRLLALLWIVIWTFPIFYVGNVNTSDKAQEILKEAVNFIDTGDYGAKCAINLMGTFTEDKIEDMHLNATQLLTKYNYPVQEFYVTTEDGYILNVIRIRNIGPVVLLMHGLLSSADDFITTNLPNSMAYRLWLEGYDVWMGNARGNKYSRRHVSLDPDRDSDFWDFSWDEIGRIDLPTIIDFILEKTGQSQIIYIGHSQGTTFYFVMCSERPVYNDKVALMIALSAAAYMSRVRSPIVRVLAPFNKDVGLISQLFGLNELFPNEILTQTLSSLFCTQPQLASLICANVVSILTGFDCAQIDVKNAPVTYGHLPAGSSTKQMVHTLQLVNSGRFRKYDHGPMRNYLIYGTEVPPDYKVRKMSSPIAFFHSDNDWLSNFTDVQQLINQLPKVVDVYRVPFHQFAHLDYLFAKDLHILMHPKIFQLVRTYSTNIQLKRFKI